MSNSLGDLLARRGDSLGEPPEIQTIKDFVQHEFSSACQVTIQDERIVIAVKGASLAGALRMRLHELQARCKTDKRLTIRIVS